MLIAHVAGLPVEEALPVVPALLASGWLVVGALRARLGGRLTARPRAERG